MIENQNEITFEQLPKAITQLRDDVANIKQLLLQKGNEASPESDVLLTVHGAAKFLKLAVPTVYGLISKSELPVMKRSKRCYFLKKDLIDYLKAGRRKTRSEIEQDASAFLINQKSRGQQ